MVGKPDGKKAVGRYGRKLEDNNKTDLEEIGCKVEH